MPRYDYRCTECGRGFEISRPIGRCPDVACPECDGVAKRVFTPIGVVFKGSGFHNTDYRATSSTGPSSDGPQAQPASPAAACDAACSSCPAAQS
ncbi:MAG TPA: FmdB family zinc ribbon protein [Coriobacteriia bacterium]|nr:FmdB family zinc ribbon protein [Coriobacteriia bacterium]